MYEEIQKILEAVERGEISAEEGAQLIEALKRRSTHSENQEIPEKHWRIIEGLHQGKISSIGENIHIKSTGKVVGDIEIVNGKLKLEGYVDGDIEAVASEIEFAGTVSGDMSIVGGRVIWKHGEIKGNVELVGTTEIGSRVKVGGKIDIVSGPIGAIVGKVVSSALNMAMGIANIIPEQLGRLTREKSHRQASTQTIVIEDDRNIRDDLYAKEIIIKGNVRCKDVKAENVSVLGSLTCDDISASNVEVGGTLKCDDISSSKLTVSGRVSADDISTDTLRVSGILSCDDTSANTIEISGKARCKDISTDTLVVKGQLKAEDIIAQKVILGQKAILIADTLSARGGIQKEKGAVIRVKQKL